MQRRSLLAVLASLALATVGVGTAQATPARGWPTLRSRRSGAPRPTPCRRATCPWRTRTRTPTSTCWARRSTAHVASPPLESTIW